MKSTFWGVLSLALALSTGTAGVFGAGAGMVRHGAETDIGVYDNAVAYQGCGQNYTDTDGDGVCDNAGEYSEGCTLQGGCGQNYVDTDGDGVCDNAGEYSGGCTLQGGCGQNYVDTDGDGVCDNYAVKTRGCRRGNGFRGGCGR